MTHQAEHRTPNPIPDTAKSQESISPSPTKPDTSESKTAHDKQKTFAHDINFKIGHIESDIEQMAGVVEQVESKLKHVLGDLKSRTAHITAEIDQISGKLNASNQYAAAQLESLDTRLKALVENFGDKLGGVDQRLIAHHDDIESLRRDLQQSSDDLDRRLSTFQLQTQSRLKALSESHEAQRKTQQLLSEYIDGVQEQTSTNTGDIYDLNTNLSTFQRVSGERLRNIGIAMALVILAVIASVAYLHGDTPPVESVVQERIDQVQRDIAATYTTQTETSQVESKLGAAFLDVTERMTTMEQMSALEREALDMELSALQLSVYGPEDDASALPQPTLEVFDQSWIDSRSGEHYAIQLVGVYRETGMLNFINRYAESLGEYPLSYSISEYRGQPWYNLFYGDFESFEQAQNTLDTLPSALQNNAPWVREMSSLQTTE